MSEGFSYRGTDRSPLQRGRYERLQQQKSQQQQKLRQRKLQSLENTLLNNAILGIWLLVLAALIVDKAVWAAPNPLNPALSRSLLSAALDGLPAGLVLIFLALSEWPAPWIRPLLRIPALAITGYMLGDAFVRHTFNIRLFWNEILPYLDMSSLPSFITGTPLLSIFLLLGFVLVLAGLGLSIGPARRRLHLILGAASAACLLSLSVGLLSSSAIEDPQKWAVQDILSANAWRGVDRSLPPGDYSPNLMEKCVRYTGAYPRRIMLVVLESFSDYQSGYFGTGNNWTPQLDQMARQGKPYHDMWANGFNTAGGLVALLAGDAPLPPPANPWDFRLSLFTRRSGDGNQSLLQEANNRGWSTHFLTSGQLSFSGKDAWLRSIGFQHIEGSEHPSYTGRPRHIFNSVADKHLYRRVLDSLPQMNSPWLMVVESVSSHPPYKHPETGKRSVEGVIRYADGALGDFIASLRQAGFFNNDRGLLILTSDQHIMSRGSARARQPHAGLQHSWDIPLVLVTQSETRSSAYDVPFQHTDVYNGIRTLVRRASCTSPIRGDIWLENRPDADSECMAATAAWPTHNATGASIRCA